MRKVVNILVNRYGKPEEIHLELARELKSPRSEREARHKRMLQREKERREAAQKLLSQIGIVNPSRADIEKLLLAEECSFCCPYSGRQFSFNQLFNTGEIQVEHVIPFSRSLDDSFANKTLCFSDMNQRKGERTPLEAFGATDEWPEILERVKRFKGDFVKQKLRRFKMSTEEVEALGSNFISRQMNDTRYASRLAARYLSVLYGGINDREDRQRIFVSSGQVTAYLRRLWSLEGIISGGDIKTRDDHRHHLVDAIVIALTGPAWVKALSDAAAGARAAGRRRFASLPAPWPGFVGEVRKAVENVVVSHRVDRRVRGPMHDENPYGQIILPGEGKVSVIRKPVHRLSAKEIEQIVDSRVKQLVKEKLNNLGGKTELLEHNCPALVSRKGRIIPIKKVRIRIAEEPRPLADGPRARLVLGGEYHHYEIFLRKDPGTGKIKWDYAPISIHEAMERVRNKATVVQRDHGPGTEFVCSLSKGDTLQISRKGESRFVVVRVLEATSGRVAIQDINDARPFGKTDRKGHRPSVSVLMSELAAKKVNVSPIGEVAHASD